MQYQPLGKTGLNVSALAMGCMRLPENDPELAARVSTRPSRPESTISRPRAGM